MSAASEAVNLSRSQTARPAGRNTSLSPSRAALISLPDRPLRWKCMRIRLTCRPAGTGFWRHRGSRTEACKSWAVGTALGHWAFYVNEISSGGFTIGSAAPTLNSYAVIALVVSGGTTATLYVNGNAVATASGTYAPVTGTLAAVIGAYPALDSDYWNGYIDELSVSNVARYTGSYTYPSSAFSNSRANQVALYHFDGNLNDSNTTTTGFSALGLGTVNSGSGVALTATPTGGTAPVTYYFHRSASSGFTPSGTTAGTGTCIAVNTTGTYSDTSGTAGAAYYYRVIGVDSAGTPVTITSSQVAGIHQIALIVVGVGDSITAGTGASTSANFAATKLAARLSALLPAYAVTVVNSGVGGVSADWTPTSTTQTDLSSGSMATNCYNTMKAAATGAGLFNIMLGTNDARADTLRSASAYQANMQAMVTQLHTDFPSAKIALNGSPYFIPGSLSGAITEAGLPLLVSYQGALAAIAASTPNASYNRANIYDEYAGNTGLLNDGVHPNDAGHDELATLWAQGDVDAIQGTTGTPGGGTKRRLQ